MPNASAADLAAGAPAPDFDAVDDSGKHHRLADYKGKTVVLYFYPKDDTPGCTVQACDFRDNHAAYKRKGAVILGVSPDSAKSHGKFKEKFKLPFPLLADESKALCQAYGVWKEKLMYGRTYMGVERSTFVIGPAGKIVTVIRKVSPKGHAEGLLAQL